MEDEIRYSCKIHGEQIAMKFGEHVLCPICVFNTLYPNRISKEMSIIEEPEIISE